jgi:hypothetical protein
MRTKLADYTVIDLNLPPVAGGPGDPDSLGYVYVIGFAEAGVVKIGSAKWPTIRMGELQCGNPFELQLKAVVSIYDVNPSLIEFAAHRLAKEFHIRGEWFELTTHQALRFIIKAARDKKAKFGAASEAFAASMARHNAAMNDNTAEVERRALIRRKLGMD